MKYENRADLLEAAAKSIRMQEAAGIAPVLKYKRQTSAVLASSGLFGDYSSYEFPLAVVEGKPVFVGDELYCVHLDRSAKRRLFAKKIAECSHPSNDIYLEMEDGEWFLCSTLTWNPPKPKTVMVEMLVEDAKYVANTGTISTHVANACRKALEALK